MVVLGVGYNGDTWVMGPEGVMMRKGNGGAGWNGARAKVKNGKKGRVAGKLERKKKPEKSSPLNVSSPSI
ncbi:unnamed protein product [Sphenostylis stenocarpa]|uniref:Uncharacterized protein n=1 Tax=Sphenostylis stenocarpa TaxID=92480 RepID=A0AA87B8E6_9FABA|nr:unnamed protein product [Sphenostylis stenocarpa]